jgi:hypothetical protein
MPWCPELSEYIISSLFDLVDKNGTQQLISSKTDRAHLLETRLKLGFEPLAKNSSTLSFDQTQVELLPFSNFFEMNTTRKALNSTMFSYDEINGDKTIVLSDLTFSFPVEFDSLFVYTNLKNTSLLNALLCKYFDLDSNKRYECRKLKDLNKEFGRLVPFQDSTEYVMTLNLIDFMKLTQKDGYKFMILEIKFQDDLKNFVPFINFDFYTKSERFDFNPNDATQFRVSNSKTSIGAFRRFYLPYFKNIWQAYSFRM